MIGITSRLIQAQQASSPPKHVDNEAEKAGREAEEELENLLLSSAGLKNSDVFRRLRIPDNFQTHRHEIDIVILTGEGIYCIEVKNYGGELVLCKDESYWEKRKNSGKFTTSVSQVPNPVLSIRNKSQILRNHLMRAGICLHERSFFPRVVLMNKNCKIDDLIENDYYVVTHKNLQKFLASFKQPISTMITDPLIPYFFSGKLSYSQIDQTRNALCQIGTWDIMELHGGRQLVGDYKGCTELSFDRSEVEKMVLVHQRNTVLSSMWAVLGYTPTVSATLFKRNGAGWFGHSIVGNVVLPYNKDIGFQIAGESHVSKIPANDIHCIKLSK
ncbi:uncharacterized protein LOC120347658 [Styela clava]